MEVEDGGDQADREHQATDDAPAQFEPDGKQRDLMAKPLALRITAIEIVRQNGQDGTEKEFKHRS